MKNRQTTDQNHTKPTKKKKRNVHQGTLQTGSSVKGQFRRGELGEEVRRGAEGDEGAGGEGRSRVNRGG